MLLSKRKSQQDLTVKGESIERIYDNYQGKRFIVNRRYQRKLVWSLDEKRQFVDSIINGYPIPIVLLAEHKTTTQNDFEIIDGMQRLNAIMGFLENEYSVNNCFFDLNTMALTKEKLDSGNLKQKEPMLDRQSCIKIASYTVPLSIYEYSANGVVDEVFRRINAGGKKLSRQELRMAGSTGHFAKAVRIISSSIRGDVSSDDVLLLNEMKKISITNRELEYGINIENLFWVYQGILTKEQIRESRDEEIIADILAYILFDEKPPSRSEYLDDYFGFRDGEASRKRLTDIDLAVQKHTIEIITADFIRVMDDLKSILNKSGQTLGELLFGSQTMRAPRYFQIVFLAFHKLIIIENKEIYDADELIKLIQGGKQNIFIPEGGSWSAKEREKAVNATAGMFSPAFKPTKSYDPAQTRWITQFENILRQSYIEQAAYDFKQGFLRLDGLNQFDQNSFEKILKTIVGISNLRKGIKGYVIVGVAEKESDVKQIKNLYGVSPICFDNFFITGIEHECKAIGKNMDQYLQMIIDAIKHSPMSESLRNYVVRNLKLIRYHDKSLFILECQSQPYPSNYDGVFYERHGNSLEKVEAKRYEELFRRFEDGY